MVEVGGMEEQSISKQAEESPVCTIFDELISKATTARQGRGSNAMEQMDLTRAIQYLSEQKYTWLKTASESSSSQDG